MSQSDDRIPLLTWLSGGAAVVVLALTAFLLVSPQRGWAERGSFGGDPAQDTVARAAPLRSASAPSEPKPDLHPLDIAPVLTDARTRAGLHFDSAALVGVRLIIEGGKPLGPIAVSYAKASGRPLPGSAVTSKRLRISYDGTAASQVEETDHSSARVLPDPNCPLEAAFRAASHAGAPSHARYFAVYAHSMRHKRPVWTLTTADGATHHVDADNCAVLVR